MDTLNGELVPLGGGDNIPLVRNKLTLGRRESCDICLPFPNISSVHCEFTYQRGIWTVRDLNSTNGIKINGQRTPSSALKPGDELTIGKRPYTVQYSCTPEALAEIEAMRSEAEDIMGTSLLEKAGLQGSRGRSAAPQRTRDDATPSKRQTLED